MKLHCFCCCCWRRLESAAFAFLLLAFVFVLFFSITIHCCCCCCCHVSSALRLVLLPVGMQTVASTRSSTSSLALRFICFYLSFSRFTYWAQPNRAEFAAGAANFAQISNAFCGLRLQLRTFWTLSIIVTDREKYLLGANNATPHYSASLWHIYIYCFVCMCVCVHAINKAAQLSVCRLPMSSWESTVPDASSLKAFGQFSTTDVCTLCACVCVYCWYIRNGITFISKYGQTDC